MAKFFKLLTHDYRSPLQGGEPVWDGRTLPFALPPVELDSGPAECSAGWNYVSDLSVGFRIAGMWPTGRPNAVLRVKPSSDGIQRGDKWRSSCLTITGYVPDQEIKQTILVLSSIFGKHQAVMASEQWLWWKALTRPLRKEQAVITGLQAALEARKLDWRLRQFERPRALEDAWVGQAAWNVQAALDAWIAQAARNAWATWDAWNVQAALDARDAQAARDALCVKFAVLSKWINADLTTGLRNAYLHGLEIALPTGPHELGWAMAEPSEETEVPPAGGAMKLR